MVPMAVPQATKTASSLMTKTGLLNIQNPTLGCRRYQNLRSSRVGHYPNLSEATFMRFLGMMSLTILGVRKGFLVVACKDFCRGEARLHEIRTVKNVHIPELKKRFDIELHETCDDCLISLKELFYHFGFNPELKNIDGLEKRFWDQVIIDGLMGNNDRNSGNWGYID